MRKNEYPGKFIVLEGLDGSGQSTQAELLRGHVEGLGHQVILTKEPTMDSQAGKKIRDALDKKIKLAPRELQELFALDRAEHLSRVIGPALKDGKIVICDRYFFSSFAYGVFSGLELDWLIGINDEFLLPDLTVILRVMPRTCLQRIEKRGSEKTLFEEEEKLALVWRTYEALPERFEGVRIIDGEVSAKEVFTSIKTALSKLIS